MSASNNASDRGRERIVMYVPGAEDDPTPTRDVDEVRVDKSAAQSYIRREPITGGLLRSSDRARFRDARAAGDLQTQFDILFEALSGEMP